MSSQLPSFDEPRRNRPFKSSGEDRIDVGPSGTTQGVSVIFHATGPQTNGSCLVTEFHWGPDDRAMHHLHELEDEGFYCIEGEITLHSPDGDIVLGPGEFGWAPRNVRHAYTTGPEGARILLIQTPGTELTTFFRTQGEMDLGDLQGEGEFEGFVDWCEQNFSLHIYDPVQYPPGQSIPDGDGRVAADDE
jgi:quercetin dioxygenase-like cupin family protein